MEYHIIELLNEIKSLVQGNATSRWLNIRDVAKYTSVSESTLRREIRKGNLKASHATGILLFKIVDIDRWLNG